MQTFEIRFDIKVDDDDASYEDVAETIQSMLSFGADEDIEDHVSYDFNGIEVIPK